MSLLIFPPRPRHPRFFDDGASVQAAPFGLDDDAQLQRTVLAVRVFAQPFAQADDDLPLLSSLAGDETLWMQTTYLEARAYGYSIFGVDELVPQFSIDEDGFIIRAGFTGKPIAQPFSDDWEWIQSPTFAIDEDGWSISFTVSSRAIAQPLDEDDVEGLKNFGIDDELNPNLLSIAAISIAQPAAIEVEWVPIAVVDEDGVIIGFIVSSRGLQQPFSDDEVGSQLKYFALDEEIGSAQLQAIAFLSGQPLAIDVEWIPLVAIDEDPFVICYSFPSKALPQPAIDDEASAQLKNFGLEDEVKPELYSYRFVAARQPSFDLVDFLHQLVVDVPPDGRTISIRAQFRFIKLAAPNRKLDA